MKQNAFKCCRGCTVGKGLRSAHKSKEGRCTKILNMKTEISTFAISHLEQIDISLHPNSLSGHMHLCYSHGAHAEAHHTGSCPSPTVPLVRAALNPRATTANTPASLSIFSVELQPREGGRERGGATTATSFLFSPPSPRFFPPSLSYSTAPVPSYPLQAECGDSSLMCGTRQAAWGRTGTPGARKAPRRSVTAPARAIEAATQVVSAETGPGSGAHRDQTERRHRVDGFSCFSLSLLHPTPNLLSLPLLHARARASSALHSLLPSLEYPRPPQLAEEGCIMKTTVRNASADLFQQTPSTDPIKTEKLKRSHCEFTWSPINIHVI